MSEQRRTYIRHVLGQALNDPLTAVPRVCCAHELGAVVPPRVPTVAHERAHERLAGTLRLSRTATTTETQ